MIQISRKENANVISSISWEERYLMNSMLNNRKDLSSPNFLRLFSLSLVQENPNGTRNIYQGRWRPSELSPAISKCATLVLLVREGAAFLQGWSDLRARGDVRETSVHVQAKDRDTAAAEAGVPTGR